MSPIRIDDFTVCRVCAGVAGSPRPQWPHPQLCRCRRGEEVRWPHHDFNEYVDLCWCCLLEMIRSGSRWSPFYCPECLERAHAYNRARGGVVLYVGRHSLMNGFWLRGDEAVYPEAEEAFGRQLVDFATGLRGFLAAVEGWRPIRLRQVLQAVGRERPGEGEAGELSLPGYLRAVRPLDDHPGFGKQAAFRQMCRFLGHPEVEGM